MMKLLKRLLRPKSRRTDSNINAEDADMLERSVETHLKSEDTSVSSLLSKREYYYILQTENIFNVIGGKLTEAMLYFLRIDRKINWRAIERTKLPEYVTVVGYVENRVGDIVDTEQGRIQLDEKTAEMYNRIVRVTVPITILENGSAVELYKYIIEIDKLAGNLSQEELEELLSNPNFTGEDSLCDNPDLMETLDKMTRPIEVLGFNSTQLTDEQIQTLSMFVHQQPETKN